MHFNDLPAEIRLSIFRLATLKISQHEDTSTDYRPFEAVPLRQRDWSSSAQQALNVKLTIVLVCREWKRVATELLYECVRVQHGTQALVTALEGHLESQPLDNGRWVRRVEISERIVDFDPFNPVMLLRVLERCPLVETVVRPSLFEAPTGGAASLGTVRLGAGQAFPAFPSVKRIDWWLPGVMPRSMKTRDKPPFFVQLVKNSPNLRYLTLSGSASVHAVQDSFPARLFVNPSYESLTTLRIEGQTTKALALGDVELPNLKHFVYGGLLGEGLSFLEKHGPRIRSVELLGRPATSDPAMDVFRDLSTDRLLRLCPHIEELSALLSLGSVLASENERIVLDSLKCIRIKLDDSSPLSPPYFGYFIRDKLACPSLEVIVLHGSPALWKVNVGYKVLKEVVARRRFLTLEFAS